VEREIKSLELQPFLFFLTEAVRGICINQNGAVAEASQPKCYNISRAYNLLYHSKSLLLIEID